MSSSYDYVLIFSFPSIFTRRNCTGCQNKCWLEPNHDSRTNCVNCCNQLKLKSHFLFPFNSHIFLFWFFIFVFPVPTDAHCCFSPTQTYRGRVQHWHWQRRQLGVNEMWHELVSQHTEPVNSFYGCVYMQAVMQSSNFLDFTFTALVTCCLMQLYILIKNVTN